jgi:type IV pilus assembly protein PilE
MLFAGGLDMRRKMLGITLIELMTVVVILAIIVTISVPSYRRYLVRTQRTEATAALLQVQQAQEKFFLANNRYADDAELTPAPPDGLGLPDVTPHGNYSISIDSPTPTTYVATATPRLAQATDDPTCATMTVNEQGVRSSSPGPVSTCFK